MKLTELSCHHCGVRFIKKHILVVFVVFIALSLSSCGNGAAVALERAKDAYN